MTGWLITVLAVADAVLISFFNADIVNSWLWAYWPGTGREIDWPASLFWSALLVWLVLSVFRFVKGAEASPLRRALLVWSLLGILAMKYFFLPWCAVVGDHTITVILLLAVPTGLIFCCSASEVALVNMKAAASANRDLITEYKPSKNIIMSYLRSRVAKGLGEVAADTELANGMIVLVNTVIAIAMTVGIGYYLANHSRAKSTSDTQVEAFTGYGVTVLLFLFGEMVPKQMLSLIHI